MEDDLIFLEMEDDLKKFANGRLPQKICEWKTTSKNVQLEDDLKKCANGRQPQFVFVNGRRPQTNI